MSPLLLALLGGAALVAVTRPRIAAEKGTGLIVDSGTMTLAELDRLGKPVPPGYKVVCPSRLPNLPAHADPLTSYGDWVAPCDVQKVANVPPPPFNNCGPLGCHVLPDGTPLYKYRPDGKTAVDFTGDNFQVGVDTWFGGVPLNWPPPLATGVPNYSFIPSPGVPVSRGIASTLWKESPAPYAWNKPMVPKTRGGMYAADYAKAYATANKIPPSLVSAPINPGLEPYVPKGPGLNDFVNDLAGYACTALSVGLSVAPAGIDLLGAKSKFGKKLVNASEQGKTFFNQICGD